MGPHGYSSMLSTIAPLRRWWARWWLPTVWRGLRWRARDDRGRPAGVLMKTGMINSAGWSLFDRVPPAPGAWNAHRLKRPYLLFEANYSGSLPGYLEAFSFVDALGLRVMWQGAYEFPCNPARAGLFYDFVNERQVRVGWQYSSYPEASTGMVRTALELRRRIDRFDHDYGHLPAQAFLPRFVDLLTRVQTLRDPRPEAGRTWTFTAVTPVDPGHAQWVRGHLDRLRRSSAGPPRRRFAPPRRTHFARLALVDELLQPYLRPEQQGERDRMGMLLFSALFDGETPRQERGPALDSYLAEVYERLGRRNVDAIWGRRRPLTGPAHFRSHLCAHEVATDMPFASYPGRTVLEVHRALSVAKLFQALVTGTDLGDAVGVKNKWDDFRGGPLRAPPVPAEVR